MDICIVRINLEKLEVDGKCIMYLRIILDLQRAILSQLCRVLRLSVMKWNHSVLDYLPVFNKDTQIF